ncbi:polysaccharide deacetylase family protein [Rufibacter sp. LB8]|uniref:polysaccharide deacetylase family protein n=1 Tax=Rufibacter sp. LB8 TaxID=2777781 RepID=UPI00178C7425
MRFHQTPFFLPWVFPKIWWKRPVTGKVVFLTFDDGPIPEVTEFVLEQLELFKAKATFFCVGENLDKYPHIAQKVVAQGHTLGNHTYHHVKAWQNTMAAYQQEVLACQVAIDKISPTVGSQKLFRPPHGQLTFKNLRMLEKDFQVVLWSALSYDFDATLPPEICLQKTLAAIKPGAIVVLHDSLKAEKNLRYVLPRLLAHCQKLGYSLQAVA